MNEERRASQNQDAHPGNNLETDTVSMIDKLSGLSSTLFDSKSRWEQA